MTMKPSPLPWKVDSGMKPMVRAADGSYVALNLTPANAAIIAKSVNSHAALVEALGELVAQIEASGIAIKDVNLPKARAALALAEKP